jgi:putative tryptophan/tyrosine transport system substrate-binding protein
MAIQTGRREFIATLGSAVAAWPLAARAQPAAMPVIGFLGPGSPGAFVNLVAAFRKGLNEIGYVEGQNVAIEYRWAHNQFDRLPELAADLVRRRVAVIAVISNAGAQAAKAASTTIPIVFGFGGDPVQLGVVASLNRPGGNVTGVTTMGVEVAAKRLGLLHELLPQAALFAVLVDANSPLMETTIKDLHAAALAIGRKIEVLAATTNRDIDTAFASLVQKRADALLVSPEPLFRDRRVQILTLAARHVVPAMYPTRDYAEAGGLMSYGSDFTDVFRQTGVYAGRVLKGEKPADMPVLQATKLEFIINLQTAKAFGLDIPPTLLARADEVIE